MGIANMALRVNGREISFISTYDESVKRAIEKAFLINGVSYLIKMEKIKMYENGRFATSMKYLFRINRFQQDEARAALSGKVFSEESVTYLA